MIKLRKCGKSSRLNFSVTLCCFEMFLWVLALVLAVLNAWKARQIYGKHQPIFSKGETEVQKLERKADDNQA